VRSNIFISCDTTSNCAIQLQQQWLTCFSYIEGQAHIYLNDQPLPVNVSDLNRRAGYHKTIPVELTLKRGDENTITIGALGSRGKPS